MQRDIRKSKSRCEKCKNRIARRDLFDLLRCKDEEITERLNKLRIKYKDVMESKRR